MVEMSNPFLGEGVPIKDIIYGLPIRWWFHCFVCGEPQWNFVEWRDYLFTFSETGPGELLRILHDPNPNRFDRSFLLRITKILKAYNADTIAGFIPFYLERLEEYQEILKENKLI